MKYVWILALSLMCSRAALTQASSSASANVPHLIRFSGEVKGASGSVGITFALYKSESDNAALWTETQNVKVDATGRYSVLLGATRQDGLPAELFTSGEAQWLGIEVQGEASRRILLVSVPYALKAAEAETLAGHAATEFVTTEKLSTAVKQELQSVSPTVALSRQNMSGTTLTPYAVTNTATNFTDSTNDQVVMVTQNGAGAALSANALEGFAIRAHSINGTAIYANGGGANTINAVSAATSGATNTVAATNASGTGIALHGVSTATSGSPYGVLGLANAPSGIGVFGGNAATSGNGFGLYGRSASTAGVAVRAYAAATSGTATGLLASTASVNGTAGVFRNTANGRLISGQVGNNNSEVFSLDGGGNVTTKGNVIVQSGALGIGIANPVYAVQAVGPIRSEEGGLSLGGFAPLMVDSPGVFGGRLTLTSDGKLGLRNPAPQATLDVAGDILALGAISSNASISSGGAITSGGNLSVGGALQIKGDMPLSAAPHMFATGVFAGALYTGQNALYFVPSKPILITRFTLYVPSSDVCNPNGTVGILDLNTLTYLAKLNIPAGFQNVDSGPLSISVAAGHELVVTVYEGPRCGLLQGAANAPVGVEYVMQ